MDDSDVARKVKRLLGKSGSLPELLERVGPSGQFLTLVTFVKSTSRAYDRAVDLAGRASEYDESKSNKEVLHIAAFEKTHAQAALALSLIDLVGRWQATQVYAGGSHVQQANLVVEVLRCFLQSAANEDYRAHCHVIIDDPTRSVSRGFVGRLSYLAPQQVVQPPPKIARYVFPCRFISSYFRFVPDHPSGVEDQIRSEAIRKGCDWCPNFSVREYRKVTP